MSKVKRQPFGETPKPAARKLRVDGKETEQEDETMIDRDYIMAVSLMKLSPDSIWYSIIFPCCSGSSVEIVNKAQLPNTF